MSASRAVAPHVGARSRARLTTVGAMTEAEVTTIPHRPAILVAWERDARERDKIFAGRYGGEVNGARGAHAEESQRAFAAMYEQLSPEQRSAEAARLNAAIDLSEGTKENGSSAGLDRQRARDWERRWHADALGWAINISSERSRVELEATTLAEAVLAHSTYLGGFPRYPRRAVTSRCVCRIATDGSIEWKDRKGDVVAGVDWDEIVELSVGPTDRPAVRSPASGPALLVRFADAARKRRREAMLVIKNTSGEGAFIVHGATPRELEARLAPLASRVGITPSDAYIVFDSWHQAGALLSPTFGLSAAHRNSRSTVPTASGLAAA